MITKTNILECPGYYFTCDPEDPSVPVQVYSNWKKQGQEPAIIDENYSRLLKLIDRNGRIVFSVKKAENKDTLYLDSIVAENFINNPNNHQHIIHLDGNIYNLHPTNLKWASLEEHTEFMASLGKLKGRTKQYTVTYSDGRTEIVTSAVAFCKSNGISKGRLTALRKGEISEYKGIVSFEEIKRQPAYLIKKEPVIINLSDYDTVEMDEWPGYYLVYKADDPTVKVRIFSKWKRQGRNMILTEEFIRELSIYYTKDGYAEVNVNKPGGKKVIQKIHRLVATQMIHNPDPENNDTVDHINADKDNNHPSNLQWISNAENISKAFKDGRHIIHIFEITFADGHTEIVRGMNRFAKTRGYDKTACLFMSVGKQKTHKDIIRVVKIGEARSNT